MKNGLIREGKNLVYYENDKPKHKGIYKDGEDIYYIGKNGIAQKGKRYVHSSMTHHIVKHGTYKFGRDFKLVDGYYVPPKKSSSDKAPTGRSKFTKYKNMNKKGKTIVKIGVIVMIVALLLLVFTVIQAQISKKKTNVKTPETNAVQTSDFKEEVSVADFSGDVYLVSENAKEFYNGKEDLFLALRKGSFYSPMNFNYKIKLSEENKESTICKLYVGEDESMEDAYVFDVNPDKTSVEIDNLKVDTKYYYRLSVVGPEIDKTCEGSFKTAATDRFISIPNLKNTRDIGGRETMSGKKIRQNMIIRGSEMDGLVETKFYLDSNYVDYVRETFGFKSDMDLRNVSIGYRNYASPLGKNVNHIFFNAPLYASVFSDNNADELNKIFSFLADRSNYPIYMHCTHGIDRTGTIIVLLDAILGMSEEDVFTEYELSGSDRSNFNPFMVALEQYSGSTINDKVENFLKEKIGITAEQIDSIRNILLED